MELSDNQIIVPALASLSYDPIHGGWSVIGLVVDDDASAQIPQAGVTDPFPTNSQDTADAFWQDMQFFEPDPSVVCELTQPVGYIFHEDPLVVYFPDFLAPNMIAHILDSTHEQYEPSYVYSERGTEQDDSFRSSQSAFPPRDEVLKCLEQHAQAAQSWEENMKLEAISVQQYLEGGFFQLHHDTLIDEQPGAPSRASTFNVYLKSDCTGGGTHFPKLPRPQDESWCQFIDCDSAEDGVVFKPIAGNAVFWSNTRLDGSLYEETLHQSLPVLSGVKVGLNIWTWVFPDDEKKT
ncbi:hypothetical protein PFICI_11964 [Pestalotiopsis fici W106-1]|uniref:Fe2OG dioxygenase domain-containing protein n=1 Tax=Pestalotiopsis fici (strain W106-1 / CGMCC3.15140) TaxID=1229662 RepID=W3WTS5_PESFW|nr:uncharacterized protein PFICI_11964 [Pestalotiopsis fici W106-1]ETS76577.1 hypothetical protein PFICI_11964 [Pestalotiopsis fici W106-1]